MKPSLLVTLLLGISFVLVSPNNVRAQNKNKTFSQEFAIIFNMGYAGDHFPKEKDAFEKLMVGLKQAHYNVILCKYEDWRAETCKKYDIKILVDLLVPEHHIYRNVEVAKALCEKLRGNETVYGYHLWSDEIGGTVAGRNRDVKNVHEWDPTHSTYVGSRNARAVEGLVNPNLIGYYDFHWFRGGHWRHLFRIMNAAKKTDSYFLRYCQGDP